MKTRHQYHRLAVLGALTLAPACSNGGDGNVNIGNTQAIGSQLSDYAATWDGYAEAYTFGPDASDRVHLVIGSDGQGTLEVGDTALLPPPTDPNVGYPSSGDPASADGPVRNLSGGVLYPIYATRVQESRIQTGVKPSDYYAAWCALQTSYYDLSGYMSSGVVLDGGAGGNAGGLVPIFSYGCLPGLGGSSTGTGASQQCFVQIDSTDGGYSSQSVNCGKFVLCTSNVCACTATSCTAAPIVAPGAIPSAYPVELDAALDSSGKTLTGTLALSADLRITVVLTKQHP